MTMGSLDEDVLLGRWGKVLVQMANGNFWCRNAVKGVTDQVLEGKLFEMGSGSKVISG